MTTDIHELYAARQKQYQDYLVEKRVHEQNLNSAVSDLMKNVEELRASLSELDSPIAVKLLAVLNQCVDEEDYKQSSVVVKMLSSLEEISEELEKEIREALT